MQGAKILLLDDDREIRWTLATVLRREGAQVVEATNGEEGLRFLMRQSFDLCVTDVCMPGLGGFGVFAALRFGEAPELAQARATPVMILSGRVPPAELAQAMEAGVDDFLQKPPDPEVFKARVRAILKRTKTVAGPRGRTNGDVADLGGACVVVEALHRAGRTARLRIVAGKRSAVLDFHAGEIRNAEMDDLGAEHRGDDAALRALSMNEGRFEVVRVPDTTPRTVFVGTADLLRRAAEAEEDTGPAEAAAPAPAAESRPSR